MQTSRIPQLDGVRGLAIALVIAWHYVFLPLHDYQGSSGLHAVLASGRLTWSGVDLFFVLSGFLIGGILMDNSQAPNRFRAFYLRRAFRILPIYLLVCGAVEFCFWAARFHERSMPWYSYLTFTQNFWMSRQNTFVPLLSYTWSLAVEEQFYLTLPWMIFFLSRRTLVNILILTVVIAPIARVLAFSLGVGYVGVHVLSLTRADALAFGVLAAAAVRHQPTIDFLARDKWKFRLVALLPCSLLVIATIKDWQLGSLYMALYGYSALALSYFLLILDLMVFPDSTLARVFRNGKLRWLGTISYAGYLFHQVVNLLCDRVIRMGHPGLFWTLISALIATAITLGLAQLSWTHFESKLVGYARRFSYDESRREKKKLIPAIVEI